MISVCLKYLIKKGILISIGNILGNISNMNIFIVDIKRSKNLWCKLTSSKKERENFLSFLRL